MYKLIKQHFKGQSCSAKNYVSEEIVDSFMDRKSAEYKCEDLIKEAETAGFQVIDWSYFDREHNDAFSFHTAFTRDGRLFPTAKEVLSHAR